MDLGSIPVISTNDEKGRNRDESQRKKNYRQRTDGSIVPEGFEGYVGMDVMPQTIKGIPLDYIRGRGNSTWKLPKKPYKIKLAKPEEGGYLIKGGQQTDKESPDYFKTDRGVMFANDTPSFDPVEGYENDAQKSYIRSHIQDVEDAVFGENFRNQNGDRYSDLMDMKSAADYWLIQQVSANRDAYGTGSTSPATRSNWPRTASSPKTRDLSPSGDTAKCHGRSRVLRLKRSIMSGCEPIRSSEA